MENKKRLGLVTGAALAVFSSSIVNAADLVKPLDLDGVRVASNEEAKASGKKDGHPKQKGKKQDEKKEAEKGCGGEGGCGGEKGCSGGTDKK
jgi:hypothetical protein